MRLWSELSERFHALFSRTREDRELDEELNFHLDMEAANHLRDGLTPEESRRRARVSFGGTEQVKENVRDARGVRTLERLAQDGHYALRSLRQAPAFTVIAVLILALGIGTSTAVFAAFDAVMLDDLPVTDVDRVVALAAQRRTGITLAVIPDEVDALRRASQTLRDVAGVGTSAMSTPSFNGDRPLDLEFTWVTANFFNVLGARAVLGRLFRPEDGAEGAPPVAVISYQTWQREFGGDPDVLSRRLTRTQDVSFAPYSIVGVAPPGLDYPVGVGYWIPIGGGQLNMDVVARLKPDVTPETARSEFLSIVQALDRERPVPGSPTVATLRPLTDAVLGEARPVAIAITVAVALLLLIACVNVGGLLLMRATKRFGDVIVRRALGATSAEIARLFFVESAVLGTAGGIVGFVLALGLLRIIPAWVPTELPRTEMIGLAGAPVSVAIAVTVLSVLVFGIIPSLVTARGDLASALRAEGRSGSGSRGRRRVRRSLVAAQVALAAIMLFGAGLLLRTLQRLERLELGYETDGVAIVELSIDREGLDGGFAEVDAMLEGAFQRMRGLPGVTSVTPILSQPFIGTRARGRPLLEGQPESEREANPIFSLESVGSEFFRTFGIPILRGRGFANSDRENAPKVAVVSRAVAERLWPGRDPIGQRIRMTFSDEWRTVVGVAGDTRYERLREPTPMIYLPWRQFPIYRFVWTVGVRTEEDLTSFVLLMRQTISESNSRIVVWRTETMNDYLADGPLVQPRTSAFVFSAFGVAALLLAGIGLYGVLALEVREQTHDLGVRMALGATPQRLQRHVMRSTFALTATGAAAGVGVALAGSRLLTALLFEVSSTDLVTLFGVCVLFFTVALVAGHLPARRATRVDPMQALRAD